MQIPIYLQRIADYFRNSRQYYYLIADLQGRVINLNPLLRQTTGNAFAGSNSDFIDHLFVQEDRPKYQQAVMRCFQQPGMTVSEELRTRIEANDYLPICWEFSVCVNDNGLPDAIQAIGRPMEGSPPRKALSEFKGELTNIKGAEQHLQQSELFYRNLFANSLDGVLITDGKGTITFASASISQILGL